MGQSWGEVAAESRARYSSLYVQSEAKKIKPGDSFDLAIIIKLDGGWYTYGKNSGDVGRPGIFKINAPTGVKIGDMRYAHPEKISSTFGNIYGYFHQAVHLVSVNVSRDYKSQSIPLVIKADWLMCKDLCVPNIAEVRLDIPVHHTSIYSDFEYGELPTFHEKRGEDQGIFHLFLMLSFAFLGGVILNIMPCVFPVLSLKVLTLMQFKNYKKQAFQESIFYTVGVLIPMIGLAVLMIILKALGHKVGWGFHMQSPVFLGVLLYFFFALGLMLLGVINVPYFSFSGASQKGQHKSGQALFSGMVTTLAATPCTAPFMGAALGFALTQQPFIILLIFTFLGLGIAFPMVIIPFIPGIRERLPKPGKWMETLKKVLSIPLFMTSIWLLWILSTERGSDMIPVIGVGCFLIFLMSFVKNLKPYFYGLMILGILGTLTYVAYDTKVDNVQKISDKAYSKKAVIHALNNGKPVFVVATAAWCLTCKLNEVVLQSHKIQEKIREKNVEVLIADWTENDPKISELLETYTRTGVPFYIYYASKNKEPIVMSELLTESKVLQALEN